MSFKMKRILSLLFIIILTLSLFACGKPNEPAYADKYIDLHLHLDGAFTLDIAKKLAELQNIKLPSDDDKELERLLTVLEDCKSLNEFLDFFDLPISLIQTKEGISEAVYLVAEKARTDGVIYAEIRFSPQALSSGGLSQEEVVLAALDGLGRTKLKANLILCCLRGEGNDAENLETLDVAKKYLVEDGGVVAIDIAGAEALYPTSKYESLFAKANEYGIPFTIHAGEADGPQSVRDALRYGAKRIGHGVRIFEDPELVKEIIEKGIVLEMCPTSNSQTKTVEDMSKYPFMDYLRDGVKVTINTDDPGIEGTTLSREFRYMETTFGLTPEQERLILANSINAAFTTEEVKASLRTQLNIK